MKVVSTAAKPYGEKHEKRDHSKPCGAVPVRHRAAQDDNFRITVLAYQWTTTHNTLTFAYAGHADTSCNGNTDVNGYVSGGGNVYASGTSSANCSTTYTPTSTQNIDIQKPVVYLLADSDTSRMILTCTRNVRWSQCEALNPGVFMARMDKGHLEVEGMSGKGKEEWVKFDVVQQTAINRQQPRTLRRRPRPRLRRQHPMHRAQTPDSPAGGNL